MELRGGDPPAALDLLRRALALDPYLDRAWRLLIVACERTGDLAAAGVYMLEAGMTTSQVANLWSPYLTMAEGLKLTAQAFTTDIAKLSCCAA